MDFESGQVVQVISQKEEKEYGSFWIVRKQDNNVVLVYSLGVNGSDRIFRKEHLIVIGLSKLVTPSKYKED